MSGIHPAARLIRTASFRMETVTHLGAKLKNSNSNKLSITRYHNTFTTGIHYWQLTILNFETKKIQKFVNNFIIKNFNHKNLVFVPNTFFMFQNLPT